MRSSGRPQRAWQPPIKETFVARTRADASNQQPELHLLAFAHWPPEFACPQVMAATCALLLNQVDWLTPAERHEIICVWSQPDCHLIDSPALRRWLLGAKDGAAFAPPLEGLRPARQFMRAAFWPNGQPKRRRLTAPAANDAVWATDSCEGSGGRLTNAHVPPADAIAPCSARPVSAIRPRRGARRGGRNPWRSSASGCAWRCRRLLQQAA